MERYKNLIIMSKLLWITRHKVWHNFENIYYLFWTYFIHLNLKLIHEFPNSIMLMEKRIYAYYLMSADDNITFLLSRWLKTNLIKMYCNIELTWFVLTPVFIRRPLIPAALTNNFWDNFYNEIKVNNLHINSFVVICNFITIILNMFSYRLF